MYVVVSDSNYSVGGIWVISFGSLSNSPVVACLLQSGYYFVESTGIDAIKIFTKNAVANVRIYRI